MAFDWIEYLNLATELSTHPDEASQRTAVSRAYYFAYNIAKDRAIANQYSQPEDGSSHDNLWALYNRNSSSDGCKRLALLGGRMKRKRVIADYRQHFSRINEELAGVLEDARECHVIMKTLEHKYPEALPRSWSF